LGSGQFELVPSAPEKPILDEIGDLHRVVEIEYLHVQLHRPIGGDGDKRRVVRLAAAEQGGAVRGAVDLDLRQAALLEPLGEDEIDIGEVGGEQLLDRW